ALVAAHEAALYPEAASATLSPTQLDELVQLYPDLEDVVPLTPLQDGLAFESIALSEDALDPYHVQMVFTFEGQLDLPAMERAWAQLIARHAVLRLVLAPASIAAGMGVIRSGKAAVDGTIIELTGTKAQRLAQLKADDLAQPFNLEQGP
ncbi:hypothetical protein ICN41_11205, partial [Polynucleobacter sp. 15G-AUS-farblos]|uniref:condensation domain-containing protein n=1 Tax=Polynucleobacter sp. 15G-AUS-farblos TaxID=2689094 RepID=UPI001C0D1103